MALPIEAYAIIADTQTSALVGRNGSIDWLCVPRFDSGAIFAALLGTEENGHWTMAPAGHVTAVRRRYRDDTLVLETEFDIDYGHVVPWVYREQGALVAVAGPDAAWLRTPVQTRGENLATYADFTVTTG